MCAVCRVERNCDVRPEPFASQTARQGSDRVEIFLSAYRFQGPVHLQTHPPMHPDAPLLWRLVSSVVCWCSVVLAAVVSIGSTVQLQWLLLLRLSSSSTSTIIAFVLACSCRYFQPGADTVVATFVALACSIDRMQESRNSCEKNAVVILPVV